MNEQSSRPHETDPSQPPAEPLKDVVYRLPESAVSLAGLKLTIAIPGSLADMQETALRTGREEVEDKFYRPAREFLSDEFWSYTALVRVVKREKIRWRHPIAKKTGKPDLKRREIHCGDFQAYLARRQKTQDAADQPDPAPPQEWERLAKELSEKCAQLQQENERLKRPI
jgi:hypothetical protein